MGLKEQMQNDLTKAIRARENLRLSTIRMMLTSLKHEEVSSEYSRELSDKEIINVLSYEKKKRCEAAKIFNQVGEKERANKELAEAEIISKYLPRQLGEDEIKSLIKIAMAEVNANAPVQIGQIMKLLQPKIVGRADGAFVASLVKATLKEDIS
jgi:uncharacterized protein YqeY